MIGHHKLDSQTPRPVATADKNELGVTTEMRDHIYGIDTNYSDGQLQVGGTFNTGRRSIRALTSVLIPTVVRNGTKC